VDTHAVTKGCGRLEKGHGSGWAIACDSNRTTLVDIERAVGEPALMLGVEEDPLGSTVE
jgi:hypothetical protein